MTVKHLGLAVMLSMIAGCQEDQENAASFQNTSLASGCLNEFPKTIKLAGGISRIGNNESYPEERPARTVTVEAFEIDAHEVTNEQFKAFVEATNYVTDAEKKQAGFNVPGGAVFVLPSAENPSWWQFVKGANWRHPDGPDSTIIGRDNEPVVQITLSDARAYALWAGRRLPTEIEWEFAAKAGSDTRYIWGSERAPNGKEQANTWQGAFPIQNTAADGFYTRAPVGCFSPNAFGLYDMVGNVWEWTDTEWGDGQSHVIKGGSFLCAENYCRRYTATSRQPQEANFSTNHIGFRTVKD